jgi:hypothetical protein
MYFFFKIALWDVYDKLLDISYGMISSSAPGLQVRYIIVKALPRDRRRHQSMKASISVMDDRRFNCIHKNKRQ